MKKKSPKLNLNALSVAYRVSIELTSGVLVGVIIGYFIDRTFDIKPWGIIFFTIIGSLAGALNVYRAVMSQMRQEEEKDKNG